MLAVAGDALQPAPVEEIIYRLAWLGLLWLVLRRAWPERPAVWLAGMLSLFVIPLIAEVLRPNRISIAAKILIHFDLRMTNRDAGNIRALIYVVQFENHPLDGMDRVVEMIRAGKIVNASPEILSKTIQTALSSQVEIANLIPQPHSEEALRAYLSELDRRLQAD